MDLDADAAERLDVHGTDESAADNRRADLAGALTCGTASHPAVPMVGGHDEARTKAHWHPCIILSLVNAEVG